MTVVITDAALADLEHIGDYIALDNPRRAASFVAELLGRCRSLADMPRAFPFVVGHEQSGVRRRRHGQYLIFYRIGRSTIDVLHIINGAQDYAGILFPED